MFREASRVGLNPRVEDLGAMGAGLLRKRGDTAA